MKELLFFVVVIGALTAGGGNGNVNTQIAVTAGNHALAKSAALAMAAGVTNTTEPPFAGAFEQTIARTHDGTSSVASEQLTPVAHYPPEIAPPAPITDRLIT
jgi:hypothetical protein